MEGAAALEGDGDANGGAGASSSSQAGPGEDVAGEAAFYERREGEEPLAYAARVFERVYSSDICRLLEVKVRVGAQHDLERFLGLKP